jgi:fatty acid desaturase
MTAIKVFAVICALIFFAPMIPAIVGTVFLVLVLWGCWIMISWFFEKEPTEAKPDWYERHPDKNPHNDPR